MMASSEDSTMAASIACLFSRSCEVVSSGTNPSSIMAGFNYDGCFKFNVNIIFIFYLCASHISTIHAATGKASVREPLDIEGGGQRSVYHKSHSERKENRRVQREDHQVEGSG